MAQLDSASDSDSEGPRFESAQVGQKIQVKRLGFFIDTTLIMWYNPFKKGGEKMFDKLHSGKIYDPFDAEIFKEQTKCLDRLYSYNKTRPTEPKRRAKLLKKMFAEIGEGCYIEPPFYANFGGRHIHFGNGIYCNFGCTFVDDTHIFVGDHTMFGPNVVVATAAHPLAPQLREKGFQYNKPVYIGKNCWLGSGVIVLPGISIGDGSVIGAGSVVTHDIPEGVVAVGNPCRAIREISTDLSPEEKALLAETKVK